MSWQSAGRFPGADAIAYATTLWDPDGVGPAAARVVVGGAFTVLADAVANHIVAYDVVADEWTPFGIGTDGAVRAVLALPNGDLVVAGSFQSAGGVAADHVARWNGTAWQPLGAGLAGTVHALALLPSGEVVAGGEFTASGTQPLSRIAIWNGSNWQGVGGGCSDAVVALAVTPNGDLVAGGDFLSAGGQLAERIARWNHTTWSQLGAGCNARVRGLAALPNGDVVAAGAFTQAGGAAIAYVGRWNGSAWSAMGSLGLFEFGQSLTVLSNGELLLGTQGYSRVCRWVGTWQPILSVFGGTLGPAGPTSVIHGVCADASGDLTVVGDFLGTGTPGQRATLRVLRWVAGQARPMGTIDGPVTALGFTSAGAPVATGHFFATQSPPRGGIDLWDGATWNPFHPAARRAAALAGLANGNLLAAGAFTTSGGTSINYHSAAIVSPTNIVYHGGPMGSSSPNFGSAIAAMPDGSFLLASSVLFSTWGWFAMPFTATGQQVWTSLTGVLGASPSALVASGNGDVFVASGSTVLQRSATGWVPLGPSFDAACRCLCVTTVGDVVVGGDFTVVGTTPVDHVARWNGTAWQPLGGGCAGSVHDVLELPNGDLLAGGAFATAGSGTAANLARWNGTSWSGVGDGTNGRVLDLQLGHDGTIWVGGEFTIVGGIRACGYVARLVPPCAATVSSYGNGCVGSGGANALQATSQPWLGSVFRSRASGMPVGGLALAASGLVAASVPLPQLLSIGQPGCDLVVIPVVLELLMPNLGVANASLSLPRTSVLVGQAIYQQVVGIELDGNGALAALTSSNGLAITVGAL